MELIIWCIESIGVLFSNDVMFSALGLSGFAIILAAVRYLLK